MYLLYHMLGQFLCKAARRPATRAGLDQRRQERATQRPETHGLLVQLVDLAVVFGILLTVNWVRTASNDIADAFSRPSREAIFAPRRLSDGVERAGNELGPFHTDLMASSASAQCVPPSFHTRRFSYGAMARAPRGVDVLAQHVVRVPSTDKCAF